MPPHTREQIAARIDQFWPVIDEQAQLFKMSQALIMAVIHQESGGNPAAYRAEPRIDDASYGLMQILCKTARAITGSSLVCDSLFSPAVNISIGSKYLADLHRSYGDWRAVLCGYNGGPKAARRYLKGETGFRAWRYMIKVVSLWNWHKQRNARLGRTKRLVKASTG